MKIRALSLISILLLCSCASIVSGSQQNISVDTSPTGADCDLTNDKGHWSVVDTPTNTTVHRSYSALTVSCKKGALRGTETVQSSTKGVAFGNILLGGVIGAGVDMSSGAAYDYPANVLVKLRK